MRSVKSLFPHTVLEVTGEPAGALAAGASGTLSHVFRHSGRRAAPKPPRGPGGTEFSSKTSADFGDAGLPPAPAGPAKDILPPAAPRGEPASYLPHTRSSNQRPLRLREPPRAVLPAAVRGERPAVSPAAPHGGHRTRRPRRRGGALPSNALQVADATSGPAGPAPPGEATPGARRGAARAAPPGAPPSQRRAADPARPVSARSRPSAPGPPLPPGRSRRSAEGPDRAPAKQSGAARAGLGTPPAGGREQSAFVRWGRARACGGWRPPALPRRRRRRPPAALTGLPRLIRGCAAHTAGPRGPTTGSLPAPARLAADAAAAAAAM